ncbi:hypothetical protein M3Y94_00350800 [Aphelenchoides besseyi]|nr:hypothetical protein M3Y94_00350800 [Aphelenchoides besseyi]
MMVLFKEFAAIIRASLYGTKLCLRDGMLRDRWRGQFNDLFGYFLHTQETMLFLALAKPKLQELVLNLSMIEPRTNNRLMNYFVGTPHLAIEQTGSYKSGYTLLRKLARHVSKFECPLEYLLKYKLPPMKLETCLVIMSDQPKVDLSLLSSKHQIRQIRLDFRFFRGDCRIVCGGQSRNLSVQELNFKRDQYCRIQLPSNLLECFPNLKRVSRSLDFKHWSCSLETKLTAPVGSARAWWQKSPDFRLVFDAWMNDYPTNRAAFLRQLRRLRLLGDEEPSFVSKEELENDPDIKLCRCYESEDNIRIFVCSSGHSKYFFWY